MIFKPEIKIGLGNMRWIDVTGISCPYLVIFDASDSNPINMLREDRGYYDYTIIEVCRLDAFNYGNGRLTLLTSRYGLNKRWIPKGYDLEYYSCTLEPFAFIVVRKQ